MTQELEDNDIISQEQLKDSIVWAHNIMEMIAEKEATHAQTVTALAVALASVFVGHSDTFEEIEANKRVFAQLLNHFTNQLFEQHVDMLVQKYGPQNAA